MDYDGVTTTQHKLNMCVIQRRSSTTSILCWRSSTWIIIIIWNKNSEQKSTDLKCLIYTYHMIAIYNYHTIHSIQQPILHPQELLICQYLYFPLDFDPLPLFLNSAATSGRREMLCTRYDSHQDVNYLSPCFSLSFQNASPPTSLRSAV